MTAPPGAASGTPAGEGAAIRGSSGAWRAGGVGAPGNGFGTAPLDAHPAAARAASTTIPLRNFRIDIRSIDVNHCVR